MPRKRRSLNAETVAPTSACAGPAQEAAMVLAPAKTRLVVEPRAGDLGPLARAIAAARRVLQRRAGINRTAGGPVGNEHQSIRMTTLPDQRRQSADMRRRKGTPIDQKPSSSRLRRRHVFAGRYVDLARCAC